jgi:serine/threonine protein kinase
MSSENSISEYQSKSEYESESESESDYNESLSDDDVQEHDNNLQLEGKILDRYNIISELGRGSYSIVWLGFNIEDNKYYAIKVQNPKEYKDGVLENNFMKRLPPNLNIFNHLKRDFVVTQDNDKFLCSVYELHCGNLDGFLRKGNFKNGYPLNIALCMIKQLLMSVNHLHKNLNVYHCDIKTDNILLRGINNKDSNIINLYNKINFIEQYTKIKKEYCLKNNKDITKLKPKIKTKIRQSVHSDIINIINSKLDSTESKYQFNFKYIENCNVSLADFGSFLEEGEYYDEQYGTRYYRSPENILVGKTSYENDVWALGCTFYELLTGKLLFDPEKDKTYDRDFYHLKLINELCGSFSIDFLKRTNNWKKYFDKYGKLQFNKDLKHSNKLNELKEKIEAPFVDNIIILLKNMLIIEPKKRFTCQNCIDFIDTKLKIA